MLSLYYQLVGFEPKKGIFGFVPKPPMNKATVYKRSFISKSAESQDLKMWKP